MDVSPLDNRSIGAALNEAADLLQEQGANPFRIRAYRRAAETVIALEVPVARLLERSGRQALTALPAVGSGIAAAIDEMVHAGSWSLLARLRGAADPVRRLQTVPGVGSVLAERIHDILHVDSLESLEVAAHDGRLAEVPGIGSGRAEAIRAFLAYRLSRSPRASRRTISRPAVATLLEIDPRYRRRAAARRLTTIAPRRFNPQGRSWLPIGHFEQEGWHFTVLYSNTARAHRLGRARDWVVIYPYDDDHQEGLHSVVTESSGPLTGRRVVRGREVECDSWYLSSAPETHVSSRGGVSGAT